MNIIDTNWVDGTNDKLLMQFLEEIIVNTINKDISFNISMSLGVGVAETPSNIIETVIATI